MAKNKPVEKPSAKRLRELARQAAQTAGRPLRLEYRSPAELAENPRNWRTHPASQLAALTDVIAEVGWAGVCLFNEATGRLIDGHARRKVALDQGVAEVPVLIGSWTEDQERLILATFDPIGARAEMDPVKLAALLAEINTESAAIAEMLAALIPEVEEVEEVGGGEEPPEVVSDRAKAGDLWLIGGKHRLMVADCNDTASTVRLGIPAEHVTILDPPFEAADHAWQPHLTDPCILFGQGKHLRAVSRSLYRFERIIDKVKQHRAASVHVGHRHAFVIQCGTVKKCPTSRDTFDSIIVAEDRPNHPHEKPVSLIVDHLTAWTPDGPVWEPFGGSGAGLIATHRTGRTWCGCERSIEFANVILARAEAEGMTIEKIQTYAN